MGPFPFQVFGLIPFVQFFYEKVVEPVYEVALRLLSCQEQNHNRPSVRWAGNCLPILKIRLQFIWPCVLRIPPRRVFVVVIMAYMLNERTSCRRRFTHLIWLALPLALEIAGFSIATKPSIIPSTTSISMKVKPMILLAIGRLRVAVLPCFIFNLRDGERQRPNVHSDLEMSSSKMSHANTRTQIRSVLLLSIP